jgi:type I restriction enzyme S subunit
MNKVKTEEIYTKLKKFRLGELVDITSSKRIFFSEYLSEGIPFYRSKEIIEKFNNQDVSTELFISRERFNEIKQEHDFVKN